METISMSVKERRRLEVVSRVKSGELSLVTGAELVGISYRQAKRVWARYQDQGDAGLVHRLRGRASNRHVEAAPKERALELYREKYPGYGPTLAAECLQRDDDLTSNPKGTFLMVYNISLFIIPETGRTPTPRHISQNIWVLRHPFRLGSLPPGGL